MLGGRTCAGRVRALTLVAESGGPGDGVSDTTFHGKTPPGGSLKALYERHWGELCQYISKAFGAGPPDPEDVAQTAFMKYASLDRPADILNPRAFLYAAARNTVADYHRRAATRRRHAGELRRTAEDDDRCALSPERVLLGKERFAILQGVLQRMPRRRRAMLLLNRFDGVSLTEIARRFGISEAAVRKQIRLAMRDCMAALEAEAKPSTARRDGGVE